MAGPFRSFTKIGKRLNTKRDARGRMVKNVVAGGDAFTTGGVLVVGSGDTGVTYSYLEKFGKPFPIDDIRAAVRAVPRRVKWP